MAKRLLNLLLVLGMLLVFAPGVVAAPPTETGKYKIGFLAGVQDPFYFTMERGARAAAERMGAELVVQIPDNWDVTV